MLKPRYDGNEMAMATLELEKPPTMEPSKSKILIVDDSATIRATLSRAVQHEFTSVGATDGEEAWQLLEEDHAIELVVTDLAGCDDARIGRIWIDTPHSFQRPVAHRQNAGYCGHRR